MNSAPEPSPKVSFCRVIGVGLGTAEGTGQPVTVITVRTPAGDASFAVPTSDLAPVFAAVAGAMAPPVAEAAPKIVKPRLLIPGQ